MSRELAPVVITSCLIFLSVLVWIAIALMMIATTNALLDLLEIILKLASA